ncbi:HNH endonuclease [Candidatus Borrarchaeum sp.]|uniref:HNH endonuclease n=1 Tax=Candidatus Borrarchaeum sp. TaxID=2846742 RepID=UPI0025796747|nr:HNH endonuclease [Candidatus Borrarchaeum sp.]
MGRGVCKYCGSTWKTEKDHVIARSKGGRKTVSACAACNQSKGDKPPMVWLRWLKKNDSYRWNRIVQYNYGRKNPIAKKVQKVRDE